MLTVRKTIVIWLIEWALGPDCDSPAEGIAELICRLISDGTLPLPCTVASRAQDEFPAYPGRMQNDPIDSVMMLLTSAIATRSEFKEYLGFISTALWAYHAQGKAVAESMQTLSNWLSMALFGRHATDWEVTWWNTCCDNWDSWDKGKTSMEEATF